MVGNYYRFGNEKTNEYAWEIIKEKLKRSKTPERKKKIFIKDRVFEI
jgi:hypothetical protein